MGFIQIHTFFYYKKNPNILQCIVNIYKYVIFRERNIKVKIIMKKKFIFNKRKFP